MLPEKSFQRPIDEIFNDLKAMAIALRRLESASRLLLGLNETIEYRGVLFQIGERFVLADVRPLAFLGLMEETRGGAREAIRRLYDRVAPLLTCRHEWVIEDHSRKDGFAAINQSFGNKPIYPHFCTRCTAYATEGFLPKVGRSLANNLTFDPRFNHNAQN